MTNQALGSLHRCPLKILEELMQDYRREILKKSLIDLYEKIDKNLALNEKFVEETVNQLLNFKNLSLTKLSKILNCSLSIAKEFSNYYFINHNEYYRT